MFGPRDTTCISSTDRANEHDRGSQIIHQLTMVATWRWKLPKWKHGIGLALHDKVGKLPGPRDTTCISSTDRANEHDRGSQIIHQLTMVATWRWKLPVWKHGIGLALHDKVGKLPVHYSEGTVGGGWRFGSLIGSADPNANTYSTCTCPPQPLCQRKALTHCCFVRFSSATRNGPCVSQTSDGERSKFTPLTSRESPQAPAQLEVAIYIQPKPLKFLESKRRSSSTPPLFHKPPTHSTRTTPLLSPSEQPKQFKRLKRPEQHEGHKQ